MPIVILGGEVRTGFANDTVTPYDTLFAGPTTMQIRVSPLGPVVNWLILADGREPHVGWWDW